MYPSQMAAINLHTRIEHNQLGLGLKDALLREYDSAYSKAHQDFQDVLHKLHAEPPVHSSEAAFAKFYGETSIRQDANVLIREGERLVAIPVHKVVFAAASEFFETAFSHGGDSVEIPGTFPPLSVQMMVRFVYTRELPRSDDQETISLYCLAEHCQIKELKAACRPACVRVIQHLFQNVVRPKKFRRNIKDMDESHVGTAYKETVAKIEQFYNTALKLV